MALATMPPLWQCGTRLSEVGDALACWSGHAACVHHGHLLTQGQDGGFCIPLPGSIQVLHLSSLVWVQR